MQILRLLDSFWWEGKMLYICSWPLSFGETDSLERYWMVKKWALCFGGFTWSPPAPPSSLALSTPQWDPIWAMPKGGRYLVLATLHAQSVYLHIKKGPPSFHWAQRPSSSTYSMLRTKTVDSYPINPSISSSGFWRVMSCSQHGAALVTCKCAQRLHL